MFQESANASMHFNPEISLGAVAELALMVIALIGGIARFGKIANQFGRIEMKLNIMFDWFQRTQIDNGQARRDIPRFHGEAD